MRLPRVLIRTTTAAVAAFAFALGTGTATAEPVKVRAGWIIAPASIIPILFLKPGIAKHQGKSYVLEPVKYQASPLQITALAAGELEVATLGYSSVSFAVLNAGMDDLKIIAEWIGVSVDELRELNPELRRTTTPMGEHELKVPLGTAPTLRARLVTIDPSLFVQFTFHTVKRGESIASIARRHKITQAELRLANDLTPRSRIRANQSLMIPQRTANALPSASGS